MRHVLVAIVVLLCTGLVAFPASETLVNNSGGVVVGVTVGFSAKVTLTDWDKAVFPDVEPTGRAQSFVFSGGALASGGRLTVSWSPSSASISSCEWTTRTGGTAAGSCGPAVAKREVEMSQAVLTATGGTTLAATVHREIERHVLPFQVVYEVTLPSGIAPSVVFWDTDTQVDSDGDGNPSGDADVQGLRLDLTFTENYNPTVSLHVIDPASGSAYTWEDVVRNDFLVGEPLLLDGSRLLLANGINPQATSQFMWVQLHMGQNSFEYMTEFRASLAHEDASSAYLSAQYAGRYVLSLTTTSPAGAPVKAAAWFIESVEQAKEVGITMADVWATGFDANGKRLDTCRGPFTDQDVVETLKFLKDQGFNSLAVASGAPMVETWPLPVLVPDEPNLPSDAQLKWLASQIDKMYLTIGSYVSGQADPDVDRNAWLDFNHLTQNYFGSYFSQFKARVITLAKLAQEVGMSGITIGENHPYLAWGLGEIGNRDSQVARWVAQQWADIVTAARQSFGGQVGLGYVQSENQNVQPLKGLPDFFHVVFAGYGDSTFLRSAVAADTAEELCEVFRSAFMEWYEPVSREYHAAIRFPVDAVSCEGSARLFDLPGHEEGTYVKWRSEFSKGGYGDAILNGDILAPFRPSFRDQVLALETMFHVLAHLDSVTSIFIWGQYWKLMDFVNFAPQNALELHQANNPSLQGKPGFQVAKFWASILDPNERNLYRLVHNPARSAVAPVSGPSLGEGAGDTTDVRVYATEEPTQGEAGNEITISYTPKVANDFGGLFKGVTLRGFPTDELEGSTALSLEYWTDNPGILVYLTFFDGDDEAFTYDVGANQGIQGDSQWHALTMPLSRFVFGGFGSPEGRNQQLDLESLKSLSINLVDMNGIGRTTTLCIRNVKLVHDVGTAETSSGATAGSPTTQGEATSPLGSVPDSFVAALASATDFYSYPTDQEPIQRWLNGTVQETVSSANWGLPGCQIKSVKKATCADGIAVQVVLHDPLVSSPYQYDVHFWAPGSRKIGFLISLDPAHDQATAEMVIDDASQDVTSAIAAFEHGGSTLTVAIGDSTLPSGRKTSELADWSLVVSVSYVASDIYESFVFPQSAVPSGTSKDIPQPDWAAIPYKRGFPKMTSPIVVTKLYIGDNQVPVDSGKHWGLAGSDLRGLKIAYSGGLFIRLETWTASIKGVYQYAIHFWPRTGDYGPLWIALDPSRSEVRAGMQYNGTGVELSDRVSLLSVTDDAVVAFMPDFTLPSGQTSANLPFWNMVLAAVYYDNGTSEFYQLYP